LETILALIWQPRQEQVRCLSWTMNYIELAQNEQRQSEMKTILFNALLKNEYIGERVSFSTTFKITFYL
jgi:hypothetical protein